MDDPNLRKYPGENQYYGPGGKLRPPRKRRVFVVIVMILLGIVIVFGGIIVHLLTTPPQIGATPMPTSTSTTILTPTSTVASMPTVTTQASTTVPSPTVADIGGTCSEDGSDDWKDWALSDWKVTPDHLLINLATNGHEGSPTAISPCKVTTTNFSVEARLRAPEGWGNGNGGFGVTGCGFTQGDWQGYKAGLELNNGAVVARTNDFIGSATFGLDKQWSVYRLEVRGNDLQLFINNAPVVHVTDDRYQSCGNQVGLWDFNVIIQVSSFKVTLL